MRRFRSRTAVLIVIIVGLSIALTLSVIAGLISAGPSPIGRVTFQSGDITLAGNLWIPAGDGPFPAIVLIHGAGKVTSEDYKYLRFFFVHHGFATLTYDKRGVGESGGSYSMWVRNNRNGEAVLEDLANDAVAGVEFLTGHDQIDPNRIGLFALSQGGWIAPLAASKSSDVAFIVLYSGPVCTVGRILHRLKERGVLKEPVSNHISARKRQRIRHRY